MAGLRRQASKDDNAPLAHGMEDSKFCQVWRRTNTLIKVRNGALTQEMLKMKSAPNGLLKTKGQKKRSQ